MTFEIELDNLTINITKLDTGEYEFATTYQYLEYWGKSFIKSLSFVDNFQEYFDCPMTKCSVDYFDKYIILTFPVPFSSKCELVQLNKPDINEIQELKILIKKQEEVIKDLKIIIKEQEKLIKDLEASDKQQKDDIQNLKLSADRNKVDIKDLKILVEKHGNENQKLKVSNKSMYDLLHNQTDLILNTDMAHLARNKKKKEIKEQTTDLDNIYMNMSAFFNKKN
jgi:hypothetical protein